MWFGQLFSIHQILHNHSSVIIDNIFIDKYSNQCNG
jgi:hypothetical protein